MDKIFLTVLNMTFTASFVIAAIILARFLLRKTPKIISYILWIAAGFRLVFPFSIESVLSLIPFKSQPIPQDITVQTVPRIDTGITVIDNAVSNILPSAPAVVPAETAASVNPMQILITAGSIVWLAGIAAMVIYSVVSIILLKRGLKSAVPAEGNIYETANIKTPFVLGIFKPKIYIPSSLYDTEKEYIILHERTHIRRHDNIIKFLAYFILSLHWFNPLVWAAFILMSADMEMSCDESVLKKIGGEKKKDYSLSLLSLSAERRKINGSPLAFGEGDTKKRIKNVLKFKKHSRIIIVLAVIAVAVLTVGFIVNRVSDNSKEDIIKYTSQNIWIGNYEVSFELPEDCYVYYRTPNRDNLFSFNYNLDFIAPDLYQMYIIKNNIVIGAFTISSLSDISDEQFEFYKENPEGHYRAMYSSLSMGSMVARGIDYTVVYESEDQREGTAVDLKYYRSDWFGDISVDFSRFKEEIIDGDTRINYYNKGVLAYNTDLDQFAAMELYYNEITDDEWRHIAETLRITSNPNAYGAGVPFTISIQPEQYNENPFDGKIVNKIFRSAKELESYCKDEVYAVTAIDGLGQEMMYLRPLTVTYDDEYFSDNALIAVTFENSSIPKTIYGINGQGNHLTAWAYQFLEKSDAPEASAARVFLIEVNKTDVEGFTEVYPGIDGAPVIIVPPSEQADEYIYINSDIGFPVSIPASWTGKYTIEHQENGFTVYHTATYDANPDMGMLFRVSRREGVIPDEWITENAGGATYFSGDNYYIAFIVPTDMQYFDSTSDEYIELAKQIDEIRRGIAVSLKESVTSARQNIPTVPAPAVAEKNVIESNETTFTITIPGLNGTLLTITNVYPMYFHRMSGDGEAGTPYWFVFKEGGTVTSDQPFSLYTQHYTEGNYRKEQFSFDAEEAFILETGREYSAFGYSDGRISSEYEKTPVVSFTFSVVSEEEYEVILETQYNYWVEKYPVDTLQSK